MNKTSKRVIFWLVILGSAFLLWQAVKTNPGDKDVVEISYSHFCELPMGTSRRW